MTKQIFFLLLLCSCNLSVSAQDNNYTKYTGKIGQYSVTLFIDPSINEGDAGYYYYDDRPKTHFKLVVKEYETKYSDDATGMPRAWGFRYKLFEYTPKGNHTGTFDGILDNLGDGFNGTFTTAKGEKLKFELMRKYE